MHLPSGLISFTPLSSDIEEGRIGYCHNGHHAALDRVAHHQVSGVRNAAWHVEREHDDTFLADLVYRSGDLPTHQRTGQDERHCPRQACYGARRSGELFLADQGDGVDGDLLTANVVPIGFSDRADIAKLAQ